MEATELIKGNGNAEVDAGDTEDNVRNFCAESDENAEDDINHHFIKEIKAANENEIKAVNTICPTYRKKKVFPFTQTPSGRYHGKYICQNWYQLVKTLVVATCIVGSNSTVQNMCQEGNLYNHPPPPVSGGIHINPLLQIITSLLPLSLNSMKHQDEKERQISIMPLTQTSPGLYYGNYIHQDKCQLVRILVMAICMVWSNSTPQNVCNLIKTLPRTNSNGFPWHRYEGNLQQIF